MKKIEGLEKSKFWNDIISKLSEFYLCGTLREYRDSEFLNLLSGWMNPPFTAVLKTDAFEEAFGCCAVMEWLCRNSKNAFLLDVSCEALKKATLRMGNSKSAKITADLSTSMPFSDAAFDLIFSTNTYGYLKDIRHGLKEAHRVLKDDGTLIISVRNKLNPISLSGKYLKMLSFPPADAYMPDNFRALLREAGFKVTQDAFIVHIPALFDPMLKFLEKRENIIFRIVIKIIVRGLKIYSKINYPLRYFTAWMVVFKAQKTGLAPFNSTKI